MKKTIKDIKIREVSGSIIHGITTIQIDGYYNYLVELVKGAKNVEITYEMPDPILTEKEKEYLSAVIKPFRNKIEYISKEVGIDDTEYLELGVDCDYSSLPNFKRNKFYRNMELGKRYTIEELDL